MKIFLKSGMFAKCRSCVSTLWILLLSVTFVTVKTSIRWESQLRLAESDLPLVTRNSIWLEDSSVDLCIVSEQSCDISGGMACLTAEQKEALKCIYKIIVSLAQFCDKADLKMETECV